MTYVQRNENLIFLGTSEVETHLVVAMAHGGHHHEAVRPM
jgi:hypothetical protein